MLIVMAPRVVPSLCARMPAAPAPNPSASERTSDMVTAPPLPLPPEDPLACT